MTLLLILPVRNSVGTKAWRRGLSLIWEIYRGGSSLVVLVERIGEVV